MSNEIKSLNEECGIFGVWQTDHANEIVYYGLHSLQHRGQEGAGIVTVDASQKKMISQHGLGLLSDVFNNQADINKLTGKSGIGHVRYATNGNGDISNIQPFQFNFSWGNFALAHNGNLTNAKVIKKDLEKKGAIFKSTSDSEVLMHLYSHSKQKTAIDKLKDAALSIEGGFAYILLMDDALMAIRDSFGFRPLSLGQREDGAYVVASETCALNAVGAKFIRDVKPGEILRIDNTGLSSYMFTEQTTLSVAAMELIYFSRPDSNIAGVNVHLARKKMGRILAKEQPVTADLVIGVPNSSLSAATGYAEEIGLPYEMGLVKNQYVGRTFIQPTQALREQGVSQKLSVVKEVIKNKKVILVDDSIVRGTTSKQIVRKLFEAGAKEVHLRIASPPLKYPDFYGIDIKSQDELIAANYTLDGIKRELGATSVAYLSLQGLIDGVNLDSHYPYKGLCVANFNGDYPEKISDYETDYLKGLEKRNG